MRACIVSGGQHPYHVHAPAVHQHTSSDVTLAFGEGPIP